MNVWFLLLVICLSALSPLSADARIRAGAAEEEITPDPGLEIQHYFRRSIGVWDPLFARCLYLEDESGSAVAIVGLDLIMASFETCDQLRKEIQEKCNVKKRFLTSATLTPQRPSDPGAALPSPTTKNPGGTIAPLIASSRW